MIGLATASYEHVMWGRAYVEDVRDRQKDLGIMQSLSKQSW